MIYSVLEQFEIINLIKPTLFYYTNSAHTLLLILFFVVAVFAIALNNIKIIPSYTQSIVEIFYLFILNIVKEQVGPKGVKFFPFIFTTFLFILFSNLIGMVPESFTITSHIIVNFTMSLSFFLAFFWMGFIFHGLHFLMFFVPSGTPVALLPLVVVIEVVSYCLRPFSLAIRLFANMMAGHILLHILSSFFVAVSNKLVCSFNVFLVVPFVIILAVTFLEIGIAFLQSYVFAILLVIYLNDSINMH